MHTSKDLMWWGILKILQNFLETKQGPNVFAFDLVIYNNLQTDIFSLHAHARIGTYPRHHPLFCCEVAFRVVCLFAFTCRSCTSDELPGHSCTRPGTFNRAVASAMPICPAGTDVLACSKGHGQIKHEQVAIVIRFLINSHTLLLPLSI